jgi:hypothetical protein
MKITKWAIAIVTKDNVKVLSSYVSKAEANNAIRTGILDGYKPAEFYIGQCTFENDLDVKLPNACGRCKHFCHVPDKYGFFNAECRYNPPTHDGFPNIKDTHWCRCFEERT